MKQAKRNFNLPAQVQTLVLILALSIPAVSRADWSFLPQKTEPQKAVAKLIEQKNYREALSQWTQAYGGQKFAKTYTGKAALFYLQFQSGFQVTALENLLSLKRPKYIDKTLIEKWIQAAPETLPAWKVAHIRWSKDWRKHFPRKFQDLTELHTVSYFSSKSKLLKFVRDTRKIKDNTQLQTWNLWQAALWAPVYDEPELALKLLEELEKSPQKLIGQDQIQLTKGRTLYQMGLLDQALVAYSQIPRSSDFWIEALEEKAWTYVRQDRQDRALGELMTISAPLFQPQAGPEPFFLIDLANLMICDYPKIFKNNQQFKSRFRPKIASLQALSKSTEHEAAKKAIQLLEVGDYKLKTVSSVLGQLPRLFHRDEFFTRHMLYRKAMVQEIGLKNRLNLDDEIIDGKLLADRADGSYKGALNRLQELAKKELKEYSQMIQKMHLVEAEVIQRIHLDDNLKGRRAQKISDPIEKSSEVMVFPYNSEVWLDEIDNYQVTVKDCPKLEVAER